MTGHSPQRAVLRDHAFRRLLLGISVSYFGSALTLVAVMAKFFDLSGDSVDGWAYLALAKAAPFALMAVPGGMLVDLVNPRWVMLVSDLARAAIWAAIALFCDDLSTLFLLVFLASTVDAVYRPAAKTAITRLFDEHLYFAANALEQSVVSLVSIVGIGGAGLMLALMGTQGCLLIDAGTFAFAAINLATIPRLTERVRGTPLPAEPDRWRALRGFGQLVGNRLLWIPAIASIVMSTLIGFEAPLFFPLVVEAGWGGATETGYLFATASCGALLTALVVGRWSVGLAGESLAWLLVADAAIVLAIAMTPVFLVVLGLCVGLGVTEVLVSTYATTAIQRNAKPQQVGRAFAAIGSATEPARTAGALGAASILELTTPRGAIFTAGLGEFAIAVACLLLGRAAAGRGSAGAALDRCPVAPSTGEDPQGTA